MNNKPSFFRQANVLIDRYAHIFINDKQNLILKILIPLLTILIVCLVACPDMYALKPEEAHSINDQYPVLVWEQVVQEKKNKDTNEIETIEADEATLEVWNDEDDISQPTTPTKIDGENYFLITNADQLAFLSAITNNEFFESYNDFLTYNYILQVDLDMNNLDFKPIGNEDNPFTGTFDGNGHIIKNLTIDSEDDNVGLFGYVESDENEDSTVDIEDNELTFYHNGIIKNLQVQNANIQTEGKNAGVIVGCASNTARINSVSAKDGIVYARDGNVGGILGCADSENVEIYVCYSTCDVESRNDNAGGLVGDLGDARISGAYSVSNVINRNDNGDEYTFGTLVGNCNNLNNIKNIVYDKEKANENECYFGAVNNIDKKNIAFGVKTNKMHNYASFLIPFKGIETAYDIENPEEEKAPNYNAEQDKDVDPTYGFKKDAQLEIFGGTQTGLFMLVCVAIFVGICNSIQEICKERSILKREYMTNLSLGSYVVSKLVVQAVVCAIQMIIVLLVFFIFVSGKLLPESGVIFSSIWTEYYITMFLLAFAADTMSLVISSLVKNSATANTFIPIILIVQIVFSGVLFDMKGFMDILSNLMISKWGIAALAATTGLNDSQPSFLIDNPAFQLKLGSEMSIVKNIYESTAGNLLLIWSILLIFIIVCSALCRVLLIRVKKDER